MLGLVTPRFFYLTGCINLDFGASQVILKHCDAKKEEVSRCSEESPLTSFSLLMSPNHQPDLTDSQSNNEEAKTNLILPEDFPIDLRVKIVVCLIYLRNLYPIKVTLI